MMEQKLIYLLEEAFDAGHAYGIDSCEYENGDDEMHRPDFEVWLDSIRQTGTFEELFGR